MVWDLANEGITNLRDGQPTCEPVVVVDGADGPILHLDTSYKTVDELQVASLNAECVHLTVHNDRAFDSHRVWLYTLPEEPFYSMRLAYVQVDGRDPPANPYTLHAVGPGGETVLTGTLYDVFENGRLAGR